jgi:hypothetical protein
MNVHGALNHHVRRFGVHHIEDRMNYLIALDPQERSSTVLTKVSIDAIASHSACGFSGQIHEWVWRFKEWNVKSPARERFRS